MIIVPIFIGMRLRIAIYWLKVNNPTLYISPPRLGQFFFLYWRNRLNQNRVGRSGFFFFFTEPIFYMFSVKVKPEECERYHDTIENSTYGFKNRLVSALSDDRHQKSGCCHCIAMFTFFCVWKFRTFRGAPPYFFFFSRKKNKKVQGRALF